MIAATGIGLVLDQGIARDAATFLREPGHDCSTSARFEMSKATDEDIVAWSLKQKAIVATLDADFHAILVVSGASAPPVIRIRMQSSDALAVSDLIQRVIADFAGPLSFGALVTSKANKTTCHRLPIGGVIETAREPEGMLLG